ncbi:MAG: FHA domain-containing protein [Burkholderiales bacterium]
MAKLILSMDNLVLKEIVLNKERTTIGRKPSNDIQIDNLAVSGEHAVIVTILNDSFLEDLGSTNGTLVNGNMVKKHFLQNNDVIELGKYKLKYVTEQPSQATESNYEKTMVIHPKPASKAAEGILQNLQAAQQMLAHAPDTIPGSGPAFAAKPAAEPKPVEHKPVAAEAKKAAEVKPSAEMKPSAESKPAAEVKPSAEMKPAPEVKPAAEPKPKPAEPKPIAEVKPAAELKPAAETKPKPAEPKPIAEVKPAAELKPAAETKPKPAEAKPAAATTEPKPSPAAVVKPGLAAIQILTGPSAGKELDLTKSLTTLGKPGVQVAVITRRPQGYFITHVEGATFPLLNGKTLDAQAHPLKDHDIIELGGIKMEFFYKVA